MFQVQQLKFNVIIPTRERADTIFHALRTVVAQDYDNLNIIVSDNFSQDNTREVVDSFGDPRISYINTGKRISMSHNWEFALDHVTEGWVIFIGDDDGLLLGAIELLNKLIQEYGVEAVSCQSYVNYVWPNHYSDRMDGFFLLKLANSVKLKSSFDEVKKIFTGQLKTFHKLPGCYHGAASIGLINRLRDKSGRFFCSQIPDVYAAIALSFGTKQFLSMDYPFTVAGISKHSNGMSELISASLSNKSASEQFNTENNIPFDGTLIKGVSTHIMVYESYLQSHHIHHNALSLDLMGQLEVAMKVAPKSFRLAVEGQCNEIARMNDLVLNPKIKIHFLTAWAEFLYKIQSFITQVSFASKKIGLMNVYDAAMFASYIHRIASVNITYRLLFGLINLIEYVDRKLCTSKKQ